jgi:hypothetical protein
LGFGETNEEPKSWIGMFAFRNQSNNHRRGDGNAEYRKTGLQFRIFPPLTVFKRQRVESGEKSLWSPRPLI